MRKFILYLFGFAFLAAFYLYLTNANNLELSEGTQPLMLTVQPIDKSQVYPLLDEINAKNRSIESFVCEDLTAIVNSDAQRRPAKLNGSVAYEKNLKFRLKLDSILGNELDIGSDGTKFWFWSGQMDEPALYWAKLEDLNKTKLKTPFNPQWMSGSLGLNEINYENCVTDNLNGNIRVVKETVNAQGRTISLVTTVDPIKKRIISHSIYDVNKKLVASAEIKEFYDVKSVYLPKKMLFTWTKENAVMTMNFNKPSYNVKVNQNKWVMPNKKPIIDMTTDTAAKSAR